MNIEEKNKNFSNRKIILGLDVSTKCIGSTIASIDEKNDVKVLEISHLKLKVPSKIKGTEALFLKSEQLKQKLLDKYINYYITNVIIEEPLISSNNSETAATLMRFNGMISQIVKDVLNVIPEYISSYEARKYGCPSLMSVRKYDKKGNIYSFKKIIHAINHNELVLFGSYPFDCAKKYILWNYISEKFPDIKWEYNKKNELKNENFDASDSLMCVLGYVSKLKYKGTEPEVVSLNYDDKSKPIKINYSVNFCGQNFSKNITLE